MRAAKMCLLLLGGAMAYEDNYALRFSGAQYVRVPHETSMNDPLIDSWTVEAWVQLPLVDEAAAAESAAEAAEAGEAATLNVVSFPLRHPSLQISRTGHAFTQVRDGTARAEYFSYEGSTYLFDGRWHHLAATWDGRRGDETDTLSLYVDGVLERAAGPEDDESGEPKHPAVPTKLHPQGYAVASRCTGSLCEEGMQIGGMYQSGGGGYTGQFLEGTIDEVRVWTAAREGDELASGMTLPLLPGAEELLLFYFPFDDPGMDTVPKIVVESKAYPWFGILGNSKGQGRPVFVPSSAPLSCPAPCLPSACPLPCLPKSEASLLAGLSLQDQYALARSKKKAHAEEGYSSRAMSTAVFSAIIVASIVGSMLTRAVLLHGLELGIPAVDELASTKPAPVAGARGDGAYETVS